MDEMSFRTLMHKAVGDENIQPWVAQAVRARLAEPRRGHLRSMAVAAILLTALVVAGLTVPQFLGHRTVLVVPAASPSPSPIPTPRPLAVDPFNCRLPVLVELGSGPPSHVANEVGFIDTHTGRYVRDRSASVAGLPGDASPSGTSLLAKPASYSAAARRWLPVSAPQVAPDALRYAWVRNLPASSTSPTSAELHRYDVSTGDRKLWTHVGWIGVWRWDSTGIVVDVGPAKGSGQPAWWLVDPVTGAAVPTAAPSRFGYPFFKPLAGDPHDSGFTSLGLDGEGRTIWWIYNPDKPGAVDWVFYETAPGQRVTIFRGTEGDATGFDPSGGAMVDSTGIWFSDHQHHTVWHWRQGSGLHKVIVTGLPANPKGPNSYVFADVASPCF
jgi:hypothetical protein